MSKARFTWQSALARMLIGSLGGFALAMSFLVGSAGALVAAGWMTRTDAVVTSGMLAFLIWTAAVLAAFGAVSAARAAAWVFGAAAGFALLGWGGMQWMQAA